MSQHSGDYEDFLRGALHAAVDSVEPAGDGLERIRARLTTPHPLPVAWLMAACSWVATYARGSLDSVSASPAPRSWLASRPGQPGSARPGCRRCRARWPAPATPVSALRRRTVSGSSTGCAWSSPWPRSRSSWRSAFPR